MARTLTLVTLVVLSASPTVHAHHAFAADYEAGNEGTISGVVTEVVYRNPHARYYLEVTAENGEKETWDLETQNLMTLGRMGWKKDTIQVGDELTVTGILGRNNTKRMSIVTVTLPSGRVISPFPSNRRTNVDLNEGAAADSGIRSIARNVTAGHYELDDTHAYVTFSYSHMGLSNPQLHFADLEGELELDGGNMSTSSVNIVIDAASIDSGVPELDEELRSPDFFDVASHPQMTFASTSYAETSPNTGVLTGDLTVLGMTRPVTLDVTINSAAMNRMVRKDMIGFSATGVVKRSDFGLTAYDQFVGDDLRLNVQVEFVKADP